jgi:hypothetical protein
MGLPGGGRRPGGVQRWSDQAIRDTLVALIADSGRWPTSREFDEAGLHRLREALRHHGGPERWSKELDVSWQRPPQARRRRRQKPPRIPAAGARPWPKWTEQTIEIELRAFVDGRADWPLHREFVESGRKGLYQAILKHGGTHMWAARVGVEFSPRRAKGRPWSEARVRAELAAFLANRDRWPSGPEFVAADKSSLLRAARRFGGTQRWKREFALDQAAGDAVPALRPSRRPRRSATHRRAAVPRSSDTGRRYWTDQRITETIAPLVSELGRWPTKGEFRRAGLRNALAAVYEHGGIAHWRARLGVASQPRGEPIPRRRKWTQQRIDAALAQFCGDRSSWPTRREFNAADQRPLYEAVARHGGIAYWRDRFEANGAARS